MNDWYTANQILIQTTLIYAFVALSFQVALRAGVFSFASIGCYGIAGYTAAYLTLRDVNSLVAFVAAVAAAGLVAFVLSLVVTSLRSMYLALVTVAFTMILSVVATNGGSATGGPLGLYGIPASITTSTMAVLLVVTVLVLRRLERSSLGRSFEVLRLNEDVARSVGISVTNRRRMVFCLSGVLGAVAGVMNVYVFSVVNPQTASFKMITLGLTMVVVGGAARWPGALIGAVIVAWLPSLLGGLSDYEPIIYGVVIVVLVVVAPTGIIGAYDSIIRRVREHVAPVAPVESSEHNAPPEEPDGRSGEANEVAAR
jgi:branched-chain amino acid transport system permease protein